MGRAPRATLSFGNSILGKLSIFGFFMKSYTCSAIAKKFYQVLGLQKVKKKQKMTFCHIFDTQKAVLGDCNFGGENDHQIQKFHLGWKVDIQNFPTSPLLPHLDTWKCLKSCSQRCATHSGKARDALGNFQEFSYSSAKRSFDYV